MIIMGMECSHNSNERLCEYLHYPARPNFLLTESIAPIPSGNAPEGVEHSEADRGKLVPDFMDFLRMQ